MTLGRDDRSVASLDWQAAGSGRSTRLSVASARDLLRPAALMVLLAADGIWIDGLADDVRRDPLLRGLLANAMQRGAVVGAAGDAAVALAGTNEGGREQLGFAPRLLLAFATTDPGRDDAHHRVAREHPGRIVAALPQGTAIALRGRTLDVLGDGRVGLAVYRDREAMAAEIVLAGRRSAGAGDDHSHQVDWLSWVRVARAALRPVHPPTRPDEPAVDRGAVLVHGGGGVADDTWREFISLAGGVDARFVTIPSAGEMRDDLAPGSYSARRLVARGCANVRVVHVAARGRADRDRDLIAAIDACSGVWIDGGRTFRFMDRIGETAVARAIARVLERGGVVGGSSAGCQVVGDLLVRGNPESNADMVYPGYTTGLQLIRGVVFDAHFRERGRHRQLAGLVAQYPQMLGIGVDARTALLIRGSEATVLGATGVDVFDRRNGRIPPENGVAVEAGGKFDLVDGPAPAKSGT